MNETVAPDELKPGDTVILSHASFVVRSVTKVPAMGTMTYWISREPDGKLVFCAQEGDSIRVSKTKRTPRRPRRKSAA